MLNKIKKLSIILKNLDFIKALIKGAAASTEHLSVLNKLDCNYIIDVGANRGQFALAARKLFPTAIIHSFEPLSEPALIFESVFSADKYTHLYRCAIGSEKKEMTIHVSERDDSSSLLPIADKQSELFPHTEEKEIRTTSVLPLNEAINIDEILDDSLLKIDVQGFELEVLKGCIQYLSKFKYIYVECSFVELYEGQALASDVLSYLEQKSFILNGVYNVSYDSTGAAIQADFLLSKEMNL